jgi:hypothetical protein
VLVKQLLQNPLFRAYYCDFMAWFLEARFTPEVIDKRRSELWKVLEQSVYLESKTPWGMPDTFRPWTNDEVYRHAVLNQPFDAPASSAVAGLQVLGISDFVNTRRNTVANQLKAESIGDSGVDFASNQWSLTKSNVPTTAKLVPA